MHGAIKIGISHMWQDPRKGVAPSTSAMGMAISHTTCGSKNSQFYTSLWQLTSNMVDSYVESDQHQWSHDRCRMHLFTVQMRTDKELVMNYAIIAHSLV